MRPQFQTSSSCLDVSTRLPLPPLSTDTHTYPGKGLSLSELIFALNEELKHTTYPPLYVERYSELVEERRTNQPGSMTSDEVSQLERAILNALAAARELKNSFVRINRIPLDILSLISTHLDSRGNVFRASFVCRHWRRTFLQHGVLWSQLFVGKDEDYVTTLLERAKGSALHVAIDYHAPLHTIMLLSPHAQKIKRLEFPYNCWTDILMLSQVNSGQLPLLRTLKIHTVHDYDDHIQRSMLATSSPPLFGGAVNLEEFDLNLDEQLVGSLNHFIFPNLTTFNLTLFPIDPFDTSQLLNFLRASPTLRTVDVTIYGCIAPGRIPQHMFVVLPNVETFSLYGTDDPWHVYGSAMPISCPRAKYTSLTDHIPNSKMTHDLEIFPDPTSWKAIVHQYTKSPIEEVRLKIGGSRPNSEIACSLTFQTFDATIIELHLETSHTHAASSELTYEEMNLKVFSQACRTIQSLPLLSHVKRLRIEDETGTLGDGYVVPMAGLVGALFKSLGPLGELTIHGCDLRMFLPPLIGLRETWSSEELFPHVQHLTISGALMVDQQQCMDTIVNLAKSQHKLEKPFECVTICARSIPPTMAERLGQWVGVVDCRGL